MSTSEVVTTEMFHAMPFAAREEYRGMLAAHGFPPGSRVTMTEIRRRRFRRPRLVVTQNLRLADGRAVGQLTSSVRYRCPRVD